MFRRTFYLTLGLLSLALGAIGIFLPIMPTVPFMILAAFCFARSHPRMEAWLTMHPVFGPHIAAWRTRGAISRKGKQAATVAFILSIALSLWLMPWPWPLLPAAVVLIVGTWIWRRPDS